MAIDNFLRFGLNGPTRYDEPGEKYLRLYGVLNATYLQQQAIHNLFKLNNVSNPKKEKEKIEGLKIREVRHKLGAHSNDYLADPHQKIIESYVPVRIMLSGFNCEFINNETLRSERVNLKTAIEYHLKLMIELLDKIYEKAITTFYKGNQKRINEYKEKLKDLRIEKEGGLVIRPTHDGPKLIITMRTKI
ncbi:MAG: hypothetical protein C0415_04480 [Thermodesulfovibrio sp.]|nr:hypothetical protein [Thermodesulfovibrio sp.]